MHTTVGFTVAVPHWNAPNPSSKCVSCCELAPGVVLGTAWTKQEVTFISQQQAVWCIDGINNKHKSFWLIKLFYTLLWPSLILWIFLKVIGLQGARSTEPSNTSTPQSIINHGNEWTSLVATIYDKLVFHQIYSLKEIA